MTHAQESFLHQVHATSSTNLRGRQLHSILWKTSVQEKNKIAQGSMSDVKFLMQVDLYRFLVGC